MRGRQSCEQLLAISDTELVTGLVTELVTELVAPYSFIPIGLLLGISPQPTIVLLIPCNDCEYYFNRQLLLQAASLCTVSPPGTLFSQIYPSHFSLAVSSHHGANRE